jgi:hypothetical protein
MIVALPWISLKFELSILTFDDPWKNDMGGASPLCTTWSLRFTECGSFAKRRAFVEIGKSRLPPPPLFLLWPSAPIPQFMEGGFEMFGGICEGISVQEEDDSWMSVRRLCTAWLERVGLGSTKSSNLHSSELIWRYD